MSHEEDCSDFKNFLEDIVGDWGVDKKEGYGFEGKKYTHWISHCPFCGVLLV